MVILSFILIAYLSIMLISIMKYTTAMFASIQLLVPRIMSVDVTPRSYFLPILLFVAFLIVALSIMLPFILAQSLLLWYCSLEQFTIA